MQGIQGWMSDRRVPGYYPGKQLVSDVPGRVHLPSDREVWRFAPPAGIGAPMQGVDSSGPAKPSAIYGANLTLWLEAQVGTHFTGPNLTQIDDQSGSPGPRNFTLFAGDSNPTLGTPIGGQATIGLNHTVNQMRFVPINPLVYDPDLFGAGRSNWTVWWVWRYTGTNTVDPANPFFPVILGYSSSPSRICFGAGQDAGTPANSQGEVMALDTSIATFESILSASHVKASPHYTGAIFGAGVLSLTQDNSALVNQPIGALPVLTAITPTIWGGYTTAAQGFTGDFAELVVADVTSSGAQNTAMAAYFHGKYGI